MITHRSIYLSIIIASCSVLFASQPNPTLLPEELYQNLLLEEYTIGKTQLLQIDVLSQFKEDDECGSTKSSCLYHVARNGLLFAQSSLYPADAKHCFEQLIDVEHMASKLCLKAEESDHESSEEHTSDHDDDESPPLTPRPGDAHSWRGFIAQRIVAELRRKNSAAEIDAELFSDPEKTDSPDTQEAQALFNHIKEQGLLGQQPLPQAKVYLAIFENAANISLSHEDFSAFLLEELTTLKKKLDDGQDVIGIIALHTPNADIIPRSSQVNSMRKVHKQAKENNGHFLLVEVIQSKGKRQIILGDSAGRRDHFKLNPLVEDLVRYLESTDLSTPITYKPESVFYAEEDSRIYNDLLSSLILGSPRKDKSELSDTRKNYLLYSFLAVCAYVGYQYLAPGPVKKTIKTPLVL